MSRSRWLPVVALAVLGVVRAVEGQSGGNRPQRELLYAEDVAGVLIQLQTIRSMIELYEIKTGGPPDFRNGWGALVGDQYLDQAPRNPFAAPGVAEIITVINTPGRDGKVVPPSRVGWVWNAADKKIYATGESEAELEKLLKRGDLRSRSTPLEARMGKSRAEMRMSAQDFWADRAMKDDEPRYPTLTELLKRLTAHGSAIPVNLVNGSDQIQAATWNEANPPVTGTAGWNYDEKTGEIWPNCRVTPRSAPADRSLAIEEYRRKGVPDPEGTWSGHTLHEAVRSIKKAGKLPRIDSPRSGKLFDRLVSPRNLDSCRDRKRPIENRLTDGGKHMTAAGDLLEAYGRAFGYAEVGDLEPIAIFAQTMRLAALLAELSDEVLADKSGTAIAVSSRRKAIEQMYDGLAQMIEGGLKMLDQLESSPLDRRRRLVQELSQSAPAIFARLPEPRRARLIELIRSVEIAELQADLADLAAAVDQAVDARAAAERTAAVPTR